MEESAELFTVVTPKQALDVLLARLPDPHLEDESCPLEAALGRYLASDIRSPEQVPPFTRSTMDGYAVRAADTFGASGSNPVYLEITGEVAMGEDPGLRLAAGQTAAIATGGMIPDGADAVIMVEYTTTIDAHTLEISSSVGPGENIVGAGKDIGRGELLLEAGRRLRPQDLGALAAVGLPSVPVKRPLRLGLLSTGDEIIDAGDELEAGRIRDINRYSLAASARASGAEPVVLGICGDDEKQLQQHVRQGLRECDMVLISGGSSVGLADLTPRVIEAIGEPGVLVHGLSIKPGKPTILAVLDGKPVFGLPGHAISSMDVYRLVVEPVVHFLFTGDRSPSPDIRRISARIGRNLASVAGREDRHRVTLIHEEDGLRAQPIMGKSGLISLMVRADGVAVIPFEAEGVMRGDRVWVELF